MTLNELKTALLQTSTLHFQQENGTAIPAHFHLTEIGQIDKKFMDCGGKVRYEQKISLQLWFADDTEHRLLPQKLIRIIELSEEKIGIENHEIEVEYQGDTIQKFGLHFKEGQFILSSTQTACLAAADCGIPDASNGKDLTHLITTSSNSCSPDGGCC